MAHKYCKNLWYESMGQSYTWYIQMCGTYIWCIHMEPTFIAHTYGIFWVFEYQNTISMLYTCCTLYILLIYSITYVVESLYMFPNVLSYHYFHNCSPRFSCCQLKCTINLPNNCTIMYHMEWNIMCVIWGFHACCYYICGWCVFYLDIYMYISCK
jgi:hypothetical protein